MVSVLFLLRMLAPPGGLMVPRPTWGTEMTVSVSTVMDPDEAPSPLAVGRRPKTRGGGGALCSDVVGVFSSLLYPDSDPDSAVDSGAIEDDTESLRSFRVIVDAESVSVEVRDDGPGFSPQVLAKLGEPYVTSRPGAEGSRTGHIGMGLGFFIAKTLLERTGAVVEFRNGRRGGAIVAARWKRSQIEAPPLGDVAWRA